MALARKVKYTGAGMPSFLSFLHRSCSLIIDVRMDENRASIRIPALYSLAYKIQFPKWLLAMMITMAFNSRHI
jgi:hypothetical protein